MKIFSQVPNIDNFKKNFKAQRVFFNFKVRKHAFLENKSLKNLVWAKGCRQGFVNDKKIIL